MNVMDTKQMQAAIQELADELADLPNFSKEYKKAVAAAKKKHTYVSGEGAATFIVNTAEKWADEMRQDRAERGSHSRMAPMESIQDRMNALLSEGKSPSFSEVEELQADFKDHLKQNNDPEGLRMLEKLNAAWARYTAEYSGDVKKK